MKQAASGITVKYAMLLYRLVITANESVDEKLTIEEGVEKLLLLVDDADDDDDEGVEKSRVSYMIPTNR